MWAVPYIRATKNVSFLPSHKFLFETKEKKKEINVYKIHILCVYTSFGIVL